MVIQWHELQNLSKGTVECQGNDTFTTPTAPVQLQDLRVVAPAKGNGLRSQEEPKPFATPFVEGTRPAGILSYPDLDKTLQPARIHFYLLVAA